MSNLSGPEKSGTLQEQIDQLRAERDAQDSERARLLDLVCDERAVANQLRAERDSCVEALDVKRLVDLFLAWPLPDDVCADPCATMPGYLHRSGTNLLTASHAQQMFEYLFAGALARLPHAAERARLGDAVVAAARDRWAGVVMGEMSRADYSAATLRLHDELGRALAVLDACDAKEKRGAGGGG